MKMRVLVAALIAVWVIVPVSADENDVNTSDEFEFADCIQAHRGDCALDTLFPPTEPPWTGDSCNARCNQTNPNTWDGHQNDGYICTGYSQLVGIPPQCHCRITCLAISRASGPTTLRLIVEPTELPPGW